MVLSPALLAARLNEHQEIESDNGRDERRWRRRLSSWVFWRQSGRRRETEGGQLRVWRGCTLVLITACYHDDCSLWSHCSGLSSSVKPLHVIWFNAPSKLETQLKLINNIVPYINVSHNRQEISRPALKICLQEHIGLLGGWMCVCVCYDVLHECINMYLHPYCALTVYIHTCI